MSLTPRLDKLDRNYLMNGRMDYWQRGTTVTANLTTVTSNANIITDRFVGFVNRVVNNQNYTWNRQTDVPTYSEAKCNLPYSIRMTANQNHSFSGEDRIDCLYQAIEGTFLDDIATDEKLYINFWFKSNTTIPVAAIRLAVSSGGSGWSSTYVTTFSYNTANVWQKVSLSVTLPSVSIHRGTGAGLALNLLGVAGSTSTLQTSSLNTWQASDKITTPTATNWAATSGNWIQFAGLSITKNDTDIVPYAGRNVIEELQLCQRYFEMHGNTHPSTWGAADHYYDCIAYPTFGGVYVGGVPFKITKRENPIVKIYNKFGTVDTWTLNSVSTSVSNIIANKFGVVRFVSSSTPLASGDNFYSWTADAELT